ncbi:hypothetical protein PAXRUDRAFT_831979 [Paxillus rubicundulus Ve08.2h10]|uniref:Unplaced genomic scaffold scaffold_749, whole genome shotgun sequence n=1 Tax=Paxillus rubicundulus Ve08.2h10 TaxID=930991 RepID=A0A0D0DPZ6_9AGAM|nr:hypothetical protein PAXRUDRAFT_831979 [Paxillus rubicundulus Ve08.2h10]
MLGYKNPSTNHLLLSNPPPAIRLLIMRAFLTLLVAITSLSTYTHVGVYATCASCPNSIGGARLNEACRASANAITRCRYTKKPGSFIYCYYDQNGALDSSRSTTGCKGTTPTTSNCPTSKKCG